MTMDDWAKRLDKFLEADDRDILQNSGKVTAQIAKSFLRANLKNIVSFKTACLNQILTKR